MYSEQVPASEMTINPLYADRNRTQVQITIPGKLTTRQIIDYLSKVDFNDTCLVINYYNDGEYG